MRQASGTADPRRWSELIANDPRGMRLEYVQNGATVVALVVDGALLVRARGGPIYHMGRLSSSKAAVVPAWRAAIPAERYLAMLEGLREAGFPVGRLEDVLVPDELPSYITLEHRSGERATMSAFHRSLEANLPLHRVVTELRGLASALEAGPPTRRLANPELDEWRSIANAPTISDDFVPMPTAEAVAAAQAAVDRFYADVLGSALRQVDAMHEARERPAARREAPLAAVSDGRPARVREIDVAAALAAIPAPPNVRERPRPGDLAGDYDQWFDGGAIRTGTGVTTLVFANGVKILLASGAPHLSVVIHFPDGRTVHVEQR